MAEESSTEGAALNQKHISDQIRFRGDQTDQGVLPENPVVCDTLVHDQLHIQGGHQVSWLVDGVTVPNTDIAGNVGPQIDPKDIDSLETQRGGYSAECAQGSRCWDSNP
ncbi:MAG: Plug domain-containing protein [Acidobacteriia bacterium]|nr:Plug domain-containing protein [Terriglobia bacterium]